MEFTHITSLVPEGEHFDSAAINEGIFLTVGHVEAIESQLAQNADAIETAVAERNQAQTALTEANETIQAQVTSMEEKSQQIETLQARVTELEAAPAGKSFTDKGKEKDDVGGGASGEEKYMTSVDAEMAQIRKMKAEAAGK